MSKEKQYTVEVEGTYHLFAESQEQANEYIEEQLYKGNHKYISSLDVYGDDEWDMLEEQDNGN